MEARTDKQAPRFRCDVCQQGFTRTDHLKRHQLRHTGIKPYVCGFCSEAFARCDSLRNHYTDCPKRNGRPIPETDQKGRRRHACELCISMKLRCDGNSPCSSCQKRGVACARPPKDSPGPASTSSSSPHLIPNRQIQPSPTPAHPERADIGSIKFLLNGGQDGFMGDWSFPGRRNNVSTESPRPQSEQTPKSHFAPDCGMGSELEAAYNPDVSANPNLAHIPALEHDFLNSHVHSFYQGPFDAWHQQYPVAGMPTANIPGGNQSWTNMSSHASADFAAYNEPPPANIAALQDALHSQVAKLEPGLMKQQDLNADIHFLFTSSRVRHFVALYHKIWHPNCPMLHWPTFEPEQATLPLQAAIITMGAMYSHDQREIAAVKNLLDIVELLVFSSDIFSHEAAIRQAIAGKPSIVAAYPENDINDYINFQNFQAAFLNIIVQHWAGNKLARDRSMEIRFSNLIQVARAMKLHKIRHKPEDRLHQHLWIQKECRVRTMGILHSLDSGLLFFHNYPCRLSLAEMDIDLPCDELLWCSPNPFADPKFRFTRSLTLRAGFEMLFVDSLPPGETENLHIGQGRGQTLGVLDMFILVHVLYSFISTRISLHSPFGSTLPLTHSPNKAFDPAHPARHQHSDTLSSMPTSSDPPTPAHSASGPSSIQSSSSTKSQPPPSKPSISLIPSPTTTEQDPVILSIRSALKRWREMWIATCAETTAEGFAAAGFYKDAYKYWLVANLIASRHRDIAGTWLLEPMCEGKLERLQMLTTTKDGS